MNKSPNRWFQPVQKGYFRKPGGIHLHVDSRNLLHFAGIPEYVKKNRVVGKLSTIAECYEGSQFHKDAHTAPGDGPEHFISIGVDKRSDAVVTLKHLLEMLSDKDGIIFEAERVMSCISSKNPNSFHGSYLEGQIFAPEIGFKKSPSAPVEIHHCFELPRSDRPPFTTEELCTDLEAEGLNVRTWSLFDKTDGWSFHSTLFASPFGFDERCLEHFQILCRYLRRKVPDFSEAWVIAEEVLGIWQTPLVMSDDKDYPNRVSVETLIGTLDSPIHLAELVDQCRSNPTHNIAEIDQLESQRIIDSLSVFEGVVRSRELEPILIELALNDNLPTSERAPLKPKDQGFAAHIVSYIDTPSFPILRAWQQAINLIIAPGGLQIDPIVSHSETYKCGFLFNDLRWWVERACSDPARSGIPMTAEPVGSLVARSIHSHNGTSIKAGCRRIFAFSPDETPAPVDNTVGSLSQGFVSGVVESLRSIRSEAEADIVLDVLNKLLSSFLLIVPFRWPSILPQDGDAPEHTANIRPGGCLFLVVAPKPGSRSIDMEQLKNTAIRLGWLLFRAALESAFPADSLHWHEEEPDWHIKLEVLENYQNLQKALKNIGALPPMERLEHLLINAPFLNAKPQNLDRIRRELSAEDLNNPAELRFKIMYWHHRYSRATIYRWRREAIDQGYLKKR